MSMRVFHNEVSDASTSVTETRLPPKPVLERRPAMAPVNEPKVLLRSRIGPMPWP